MIQIRWNSLNYYTINSRFGAANFHEIIDQIFSSIINNVINSIPWTDSSMCFIVDKKKEKKKKKTIKDLDRPINHLYENKEMASFDLGKKIRQRSSHTFFNRVTLIYPAGNLCRLPRSLQSSASTLHTHHARLSAFLLTYAPPLSVGVEAARRPDCMYTTGITGRERAQNSLSAPSLAEAVRANEWFELVPVTIMEPFEDRRVHHADTPTRRTSVVSR